MESSSIPQITINRLFLAIWRLPRRLLALLVALYQKTLSPDHGFFKRFFPHGYCKYHPTCSQYAKESVLKHGVIYGSVKAVWRFLRCNPWSKGGVDRA